MVYTKKSNSEETHENGDIILDVTKLGFKVVLFDNFNDSYYHYQFQYAQEVLQDIVFHLFEETIEETNEETNKKDNLSKPHLSEDEKQYYNIISFVGKRGTGKTSAMLSIKNMLEYERDDIVDRIFPVFYDPQKFSEIHISEFDNGKTAHEFINYLKEISFVTLPVVDGSMLMKNEDIFKVILAQMYQKLLNEKSDLMHRRVNEAKIREVIHQFDELYQDSCRLDGTYSSDESSLVALRDLSSSVDLRNNFGKLVQDFLEIIDKKRKKHQFLVISIDDMDLNIKKGFKILEQVNRYLTIKNIIVLVSYDSDQMRKLCEKHYFKTAPKYEYVIKTRGRSASILANDYMEKTLPYAYRIYMPDFEEKSTNLLLDINSFDRFPFKKALFRMIYIRTGVRFDEAGEKKHFITPSTIRGAASFIIMLKEIKQVFIANKANYSDESVWEEFKKNHELLFDDIKNRVVIDNLFGIEHQEETNGTDPYLYVEQFNSIISAKQTERIVRRIVEHIDRLYEDRGDDNDSNVRYKALEAYYYRDSNHVYSYGNLLRGIYRWGRCSDEDKAMIRCVLAYLSFALERDWIIYERERSLQPKNKFSQNNRLKEYRNRLCFILDGSIGGSWSDKMFPLLQLDNDAKGSVGRLLIDTKNHKQHPLVLSLDVNRTESSNRIAKIIRTAEVISLFFSEPLYKSQRIDQMKCELTIRTGENEYIEQNIKAQNVPFYSNEFQVEIKDLQALLDREIILNFTLVDNMEFNMFNFVNNLFEIFSSITDENEGEITSGKYYNRLRGLREALKNRLEEEVEKLNVSDNRSKKNHQLSNDGNNDKESEIDVTIRTKEKEYADWSEMSLGAAIPFYQIDLTYNIFKRLRQAMYNSSSTMTPNDALKYYQETLRSIEKKLKDNDVFYGVVENDSKKKKSTRSSTHAETKHNSYAYRFNQCPFVRWIYEPEKYLCDNFSGIFGELLVDLLKYSKDKPDIGEREDTV